jgi:sec-independent protein translocase protein TatA
MFGIGMPELCILLVILVLVTGPAKLPQLGQALGSSIRGFKKALNNDETTKIEPPAA